MRKKIILLLLLITCFLLGGCEKEEEEPIEITLIHGWGTTEADHVRMRRIYKDFEKDYPNIKLNLVSMISPEEVVNKVEDMLSVGKVPDLVCTSGYGKDNIYQFMREKEKAVDLLPSIEADSKFAASIAPEVMSYWKQDGHLYTVSDVLMLAGGYWYNEEIFQQAGVEQPPKTWEEFFDPCERIKEWSEANKKAVLPIQITQESSVYLVEALLADAGGNGERAVEARDMDLTGEDYRPVLETMKQLYQYGSETGKYYGYRDVVSMFNSGRVAMYINGVWASALIHSNIPVKYAVFPGKDGRTLSCSSAAIGYIAGNTGDEKRMDASIQFLKYMLSEEVQKRILLETGQMPSNPTIQLEDYRESIPLMYQAAEAVRHADRIIEIPNNLWTNRQIENFQSYIMDVMSGEMDAEMFVKEINR